MRFLLLAALVLLAGPAAAMGELKTYAGAAADFVAQDMQGRPVHFDALRGKVVLLNFWATWCPPCRKEMPAMEQLHQTYRDRGLVVVAVSQDTVPLEKVKRFVALLGLSFPIWYDRDGGAGRRYEVPGVPASYLISADGQIAYRVLGEYDWTGREALGAIELLLSETEK